MKQGLFYNVDLECQEYKSFKLQKCFDICPILIICCSWTSCYRKPELKMAFIKDEFLNENRWVSK